MLTTFIIGFCYHRDFSYKPHDRFHFLTITLSLTRKVYYATIICLLRERTKPLDLRADKHMCTGKMDRSKYLVLVMQAFLQS
jgi:hypothetical protein